jgi:hypothetical protein
MDREVLLHIYQELRNRLRTFFDQNKAQRRLSRDSIGPTSGASLDEGDLPPVDLSREPELQDMSDPE